MRPITWMLVGSIVAGCGRSAPADHAAHSSADAATTTAHAAHATSPAPGATPPGYAEVAVPASRQQLIGVKIAEAERQAVAGNIRATAIVRTEETREAHVHTKVMGYIDKLYVSAVGQKVKKGQPLYSLYSQDLLVAQEEYLRARGSSPALADAARQRLKLWDIADDEIARLETQGPQRTLTVRAPIGGTVLEKNILRGHYVEPEMTLYVIADLAQVWIVADVYETEVGRLDRSGRATVTVQGLAESFGAAIDYVYPTVDPVSRTVQVRLVADNPRGDLRPGSYATVELPLRRSDALTVPEEAVIDTGVRKIVYLALPEGRFRPVEVEVGRRADGRAEIRAGLEAGAKVVVSAQFLIDSESQIRGSTTGAAHGGH